MIKYINKELSEKVFSENKESLTKAETFLKEEYKDKLIWTDIEKNIKIAESIKNLADKIKSAYDLVIVCGVGGSYLGSRAVIEAINGFQGTGLNKPSVIYMGNNLSVSYISNVMDIVKASNPCLIVISKSGNTMETLIGFKIIKDYMEETYKDYKNRIYIITADNEGSLNRYRRENDIEFISLDDDLVGRYSLLSPVGLLPMAICGIDIDALLQGALDYKNHLERGSIDEKEALKYALSRKLFFQKGKNIEILTVSNPNFEFLLKWYVQLFSESEGKSKEVILPIYLIYSQDLHSMGQFLQEGPNNIFESHIDFQQPKKDYNINLEAIDSKRFPGLNKFSLESLNKKIMKAARKAHKQNGIDSSEIILKTPDEYHLGQLLYFFMYSASISSVLFGVNPYNQPGVEKYKSIFREIIK
ncbi:hypothetical protein [Peptoniphilus catoniae]|uniref:hypothetical protein n=1 Tax=Peptoniphilus catoniae TaxID=1660341 RepID=UPI0015D5C757|nr:hypothetical protein [Peptoniphilus catoniae]